MNILFFSLVNINYASGFDRLLLDIIESHCSSTDKITVVTSNYGGSRISDSYIHKKLNGKAKYFKEKIFILKNIPVPTFSFIKTLYLKFKSSDVIYYVFGFIFYDLLVLLFKLLLRKKVIISFHAPLFIENNPIHNIYVRIILRMTLRYYDKIHTINREDSNFFEKWGFKDKVIYIPNGIKMDKLLSLPIEKKFLYDKLRFAFVGRFERQKSIDLLINIIPKLINLKIEFYFAGKGSFEDEVAKLAEDFNSVKYFGFLNFNEIDKIYSQTDILILPSRQEPFGLVIIEALASGLPVIATRTRGPKDLLEENRTGWFISEVSEESIYAKIIEIYNRWLQNKTCFKNMPFQCRETAKEYTIENMIKKMWQKLFS